MLNWKEILLVCLVALVLSFLVSYLMAVVGIGQFAPVAGFIIGLGTYFSAVELKGRYGR